MVWTCNKNARRKTNKNNTGDEYDKEKIKEDPETPKEIEKSERKNGGRNEKMSFNLCFEIRNV